MQYATIHIQANPFVSIWFSRFENCSYLASRSSSADMRERERERETTKETLILSSPLLLSSHPSGDASSLRGRYGVLVEEKRGPRRRQAGRQLHCSPILVRADSHEQRGSRAASTEGGTGGGGSMNSSGDDRDR